jgi:O-methyltransferase
MINKRKIVLFGCGEGGKNAFNYLQKKYDIVAFSDNNPNLHGKSLENIPIVTPEDLKNIKYDYILISSMYSEDITKQLTNTLNILEKKIKSVDKDVLLGNKANIFIELFFAGFVALLVWSIVRILDSLIK